MNKVIQSGNITAEPETRVNAQTQKGATRFRIAVNRKGKDKGTDFFSCVAFGKTGEFVQQYLHKGSKVALSGRLQSGEYTNQQGIKTYTTEIVVEEIEFNETKAAADQRAATQPQAPQAAPQGYVQPQGYAPAPPQGYPQAAPQGYAQAPAQYPQGQPYVQQPQAPQTGPVPTTVTVGTNEPGFAPQNPAFPAPPMYQ